MINSKQWKILGVLAVIVLLIGAYFLWQHQNNSDLQLATENNNPGLLKNSSGKLLTFNSPTDGRAALYNYLTAVMASDTIAGIGPNSSLIEFAKVYAPTDPLQYAANLANQLNVSPDTQLKALISRIDDFATAVTNNNGFENR